MEDEEMRKIWQNFQKKYPKLFGDREEEWKKTLKDIMKYIDENGKRPLQKDEDENVRKLGNWMNNQKHNYDKTKEIMATESIRKLWEQFQKKYSKYFR